MALQSPDADGVPAGRQRPSTTWGEYNNIAFAIQPALSKMQTAMPVRVEACTNTGGIAPVGFVDITPLVNQVDAGGNPTPHVTIYNVPYSRLQGGTSAVIIDPKKGDIGVAVFASRDISKIKSTRDQGNPGSSRQYSFSDALYLGGLLNGAPTQYVQFTDAGITIKSPQLVKLDAPNVSIACQNFDLQATAGASITTPTLTLNGAIHVTGAGTFDADVTAQGTSVHTHKHGSVQPGMGVSGVPI